jgi:hypothetical protein
VCAEHDDDVADRSARSHAFENRFEEHRLLR